MEPLIFSYGLRSRSTGLYYTGEAGDNWLRPPSLEHPIFRFTEKGAYYKRDMFRRMPLAVNDFEVVVIP
jgi:hypothetical protein